MKSKRAKELISLARLINKIKTHLEAGQTWGRSARDKPSDSSWRLALWKSSIDRRVARDGVPGSAERRLLGAERNSGGRAGAPQRRERDSSCHLQSQAPGSRAERPALDPRTASDSGESRALQETGAPTRALNAGAHPPGDAQASSVGRASERRRTPRSSPGSHISAAMLEVASQLKQREASRGHGSRLHTRSCAGGVSCYGASSSLRDLPQASPFAKYKMPKMIN